MRSGGRAVRMGVALLLAVLVAGCGGSGDVLDEPGATPEPRTAPPQEVSVCSLVSPDDARRVAERDWHVVGLAYTAARLPTLRCGLGTHFDRPQLTVQFTAGPVAPLIFGHAYGDPAGGDPRLVRKLGERAFLRAELGKRTLHVLVHEAIVTLQSPTRLPTSLGARQLVELGRVAAQKVPANPTLGTADAGERCEAVDAGAVDAAIGLTPVLRTGLAGAGGSLTCSWASLPGTALVTVYSDPGTVSRQRTAARSDVYLPVTSLSDDGGIHAVSRTDVAGDLLILHHGTAIRVSVTPTAGFFDDAIATTPGERQLARSVVDTLT